MISKRHRTLLRKSRPSTPPISTTQQGHGHHQHTPDRPATSGGLPLKSDSAAQKRHSAILGSASPDHQRNTSTRPSESRRWSMLPTTVHRPATGHSMRFGLSERPTTSGPEDGTKRPMIKRRWTAGLRNLFSRDHEA